MKMIDFDFLPEIPIDTGHTLDQLTPKFHSVKNGLPELIKNSKDQYSRLGLHNREDRQILVRVSTQQRNLVVIDFAGAGPDDYQGWTTWSARTGSHSFLASDIEGEYGNGGKSFMVRGSTTYSYMESCTNGYRTKMGFQNDDPEKRYLPGYTMEGGKALASVPEKNPVKHFESILKTFRLGINDLPKSVKIIFEKRKGFTAVFVGGIKDWTSKRLATIKKLALDIPQRLADHGQAALTIETCDVWLIVDGKLITNEPIKPVFPDPYPGFENLQAIPVPQLLVDPETEEQVDTGIGDERRKYLWLRTSSKNLRMTDELKARNVIRVWNDRNNVATWRLPELGLLLLSTHHIYGELRVPALREEHLAGADRVVLADTPLTRGLEQWVTEQVKDLAEKIQKEQMRETRTEERERGNKVLDGLRDLMRKYLETEPLPGDDEDDSTGGDRNGDKGGRGRTRKTPKYGSRVDKILLERGRPGIAVAAGTKVPLLYTCFEILKDGKRKPVRGVPLILRSNISGHAKLDSGDMLSVETGGMGEIWLETEDGMVSSNKVILEAVLCSGVDIIIPTDPLMQGQRAKIGFFFHTDRVLREDLLVEASIDEPEMAVIGRHGYVTAGLQEGTGTLHVRYGPARTDNRTETLTIGPDRVERTGRGGDAGGNIPNILFCGTEAPNMRDYPKEQRTHPGGEHHPTIIEEPQFRGVVWINPTSKEAARVRKSRGGPSGVGRIATQTFLHFVALKCFEILKRLWVRQEIGKQSVTETQFIQLAAAAEISCTDFIDAAYDLTDELLRHEKEANS
jgi:hypothetical protein